MDSQTHADVGEEVIGITYTDSRLVVARVSPARNTPIKWQASDLGENEVVSGVIQEPKWFGRSIRDRLNNMQSSAQRCVVVVPDHSARIEVVTFPRMSTSQRLTAARTNASKFFRDTSRKALDVSLVPFGERSIGKYIAAYIEVPVKASIVAAMRSAGFHEFEIAIERVSAAWRASIAEDAVLVVSPEQVALYVFVDPVGDNCIWLGSVDIFERVDAAIKDLRRRSHYVESIAVVGEYSRDEMTRLSRSVGARVTAVDDAAGSPWRLAYGAAATEWTDRLRTEAVVA